MDSPSPSNSEEANRAAKESQLRSPRLRMILPDLVRHFAWQGVIALAFAVALLQWRSGLNLGAIALFGFPTAFAAVYTRPEFCRSTRRVACAFLGTIGIGFLVAHEPVLFPRLGAVAPQIGQMWDRVLTWYAGVYLVWLMVVLPIHLFVGNARAHARGKPMQFALLTCVLGLIASQAICPGLLWVLWLMGFWPIL